MELRPAELDPAGKRDLISSLQQVQERLRTEAQARHDDIRLQVEAHLRKLLTDAQARIEVDMDRVFREVDFIVQASTSKTKEMQQRLWQQEAEIVELRKKINQVKSLAGAEAEHEVMPPAGPVVLPLDGASLPVEQLASATEAAAFARRLQRADTLSRAEMRNAGKQLELQAQTIQQLQGDLLTARSGAEERCAEVQELRKKISDIASSDAGSEAVVRSPPKKARSPERPVVPKLRLEHRVSSSNGRTKAAPASPPKAPPPPPSVKQHADELSPPTPGSPVRIIDCAGPIGQQAPHPESSSVVRQAQVPRTRLLSDGSSSVTGAGAVVSRPMLFQSAQQLANGVATLQSSASSERLPVTFNHRG